MSVIVFKIDEVVVGVFDNKVDFKNMSFKYIIEHMMSKYKFETRRNCGLTIKEDLKMLNREENYTFTVIDSKFERRTLLLNTIKDNIHKPKQSKPKQAPPYKVYKLCDLVKPISLIDISRYIT